MNRNLTIKSFTLFALFFLSSSFIQAQIEIFSEDFADGLPTDWTTVQKDGQTMTSTSNWNHTFIGPTGGTPTLPIESTTFLNGWMIFDSDLDCTGNTQDAWLISPYIDCSAFDTVVVKFESYYRTFNDRISIQVSTDSLDNWKEFEIYPNIIAQEYGEESDGSENPADIIINISDTASFKQNVRIAFRFHSQNPVTDNGGQGFFGCAYNWQVDDLKIFDFDPTPKFDMKAKRNFYAIAPSMVTPASQVVPLGFLCDIENVGLLEVTNTNLNISIKNNDDVVVHSQDTILGNIIPDELVENTIFKDQWTPPSIKENYTGTYKITTSEIDGKPQNNEIAFPIIVSDSIFSKELGISSRGFSPTAAINSGVWTAANHYYVPNGSGYICSSVLFGIANTNDVVGSTVNIFLFEWENLNNDLVVDAIERNGASAGRIVGNTTYVIQPGDEKVIVVLDDFDGSPENKVRLKDDTHYILAIETSSSTPQVPVQLINGGQNYIAMFFLNSLMGIERYGSFTNRNSIGNNISYELENFAPMIRMHIQEDLTSTLNMLSPEHKVQIYPIPANDILNIDLDFPSAIKETKITITDISGRTLFSNTWNNVKNNHSEIKLTNFPQGSYFLTIETTEGNRTEKFTIAK